LREEHDEVEEAGASEGREEIEEAGFTNRLA
jgi:hypothetical protein